MDSNSLAHFVSPDYVHDRTEGDDLAYYSEKAEENRTPPRFISEALKGPETAADMFETVRSTFPERFSEKGWYLTVVAALVASGKPKVVGDLYSYLISQPEYSTTEQRKVLIRRVREALVRCCIVNGVPIVLEAVSSISAVEKEEDKDYTFLREHWQPGEANTARTEKLLKELYRDDLPKILSKFSAHRDILYMTTGIQYGLVLTEATEINEVENEFVVLPAVMCNNLAGPTLWHLRACLRIGDPAMTKEEVEQLHQSIEIVAAWAGKILNKVGRVEDVVDEMHDRL